MAPLGVVPRGDPHDGGFCYTDRSASKGKTRQAAPGKMCSTPSVGEWLSLVEHLVRDQGVGGSNPLSPTIRINHLQAIPQDEHAPFLVQGRQLGRH